MKVERNNNTCPFLYHPSLSLSFSLLSLFIIIFTVHFGFLIQSPVERRSKLRNWRKKTVHVTVLDCLFEELHFQANGGFTLSVMRRRRRSMDWDWRRFAWEEADNLTEERINDTLLVGSEKKIKKLGVQVGNSSDEKLKKRGRRTTVVAPARSPTRDGNLTCLVDGCESDLSNCKDYHRRHRVCERHSKIPVVLVRGEERRFCQQCSRFHSLGEFDEVKRSCRKRLDGHNRRRRKPQPESIYLTPKDFLSNFKGPRILQFSNMPDLDAKIGLAPYSGNRRELIPVTADRKAPPNPSVARICRAGDKQLPLKQTSEKEIKRISSGNPSPGSGREIWQPVNSGCALYLLSSSPSQASGAGLSCFDLPQEYCYGHSRESAAIAQEMALQTRGSGGLFEPELSPSFLNSLWGTI